MTEDIASKLEVILFKLSNTEMSVKNVESNLVSLEKRMTKLRYQQKVTLKQLTKRIDTLNKKLSNSPTVPAIKDQMGKFRTQLLQLRKKHEELAVLQEQ